VNAVNAMKKSEDNELLKRPDPRREGFASAEEASRFLNLSRAMVTKMTQAGTMPYRRFGRALRIPWNWLLDQVDLVERAGKIS
jgi:excisionase family DNA binding protein